MDFRHKLSGERCRNQYSARTGDTFIGGGGRLGGRQYGKQRSQVFQRYDMERGRHPTYQLSGRRIDGNRRFAGRKHGSYKSGRGKHKRRCDRYSSICKPYNPAASEKSIYLLADTLLPALKDAAKQATLQKRIDGRMLEQLLKYVEQIVVDGHASKAIPFSVMGGTTRHLLSLFDSIRLQRNDAIHPMNFVVSADSVRFMLNAFPLAFQKVEALQKWCNAHPNTL